MMPSKTVVSIGTLIGLLLPVSAGAYTPPNEVLTNENVYEGFILPPNKRSVQQRVQEQQDRSATRRTQEQAGLFEEDEEPVKDEEPMEEEDSGANDLSRLEEILSSLEQSLSTKNETEATISRERQRLMERIAIQELERELMRGAAPEIYAGETNVTLRPGAPLQPTGPASVAAGACLAAAGLWTVLRAGRMQTQPKEQLID